MERKILISNAQKYYPSQFLLLVANDNLPIEFLYPMLDGYFPFFQNIRDFSKPISKFIFPFVNAFNIAMMIDDRNNFYEKADDLLEIVQPQLKNGDEFSRIEASYGFSILGLQSFLGLTVGTINLFGTQTVGSFINKQCIGLLNTTLKSFEYGQIGEIPGIEGYIKNFLTYANYTILGIGALSIFFGQDSAKVYAVYKKPGANPELEMPILEAQTTLNNTNNSKIIEEVEIDLENNECEDFQEIIEDNNLDVALSLA